MKNWGIYYFIFVIMVSILPCSDSLEAHQFTNDKIERSASDKNNDALEHCVAMCLCNCCGQNVIPAAAFVFEMKTPLLLVSVPISSMICYSGQNIRDIWQPPKL